MASVPQLFDDLCEALLPAAKARLGQRGVSRKRAKQGLKRVAYNALFTNLFQEETHKLQADLSKLPVKNKVLLLSFDLRAGGLGPEADRLEELVEELQAAPGCPLTEVASVLDLLVRLAGSGPPQVLRRKRDYFFNNKHVGRNVPYSGYDCYDLSVFEMDVQSLISREEYLCQDMVRKALQVMEAAPGTGLPTVGLFSYGDPCSDRFERDTRVSLFGALVHSRTYDMDVRLDLPPMPDSADLSGLAIKVPQSVDQSEDEGFQSASNLTPDSQSEPGMTPDIDLWDAVLTYEASKRRCWEQVGCPPGHKEEPYLTEAGRDTFDRFCRLRQGELQVLGGGLLQAPQPVLVKECELVKDALNVLIGVVSTTFSLCQPAQTFMVRRGVHVSGASPESISSLLSEVAECGTHYARLSQFSLQPLLDSSCSKGLVLQAFTSGLRRYLQYYRACVLSTPPTLSLLTIGFLFKKLGRQLRYLAELCGVGGGGPRAEFPTGVRLLSYLYQEALDNCSNEHYPVLLSLLQTSCEPYTRFIHDWVYSGLFRDTYGEFMIQVNHEYLGFRDKFYWTHGYVLISKEVEDCVPVFLKHIAHDVYVCGKTINLLKLCCPRHYLCWSDVPVPRISVIFSPEELKEVERDCAIYVGRMERVARHSSISKEEKELRMEIAKQELIVQAREAASRVLRALSDRQTSERMALDARKREQFQRLKEQFVRDQERRRAARQEDPDGDFGYARELRDRERRLRALEEQLERKARQALVDHYSKLSAEAARREQKALWKIQRHRLAGARLRFLIEDEKRTREMLKDVSAKDQQPLLFQASSPGPEHLAGGGTCDSGHAGRHVAAYDCASTQTPQLPRPLVAAVCGPQPERVDRPGPFSEGLGIQDFLPTAREAGEAEHVGVAPILEEALQTIGSDLPPSAVSEVAGTEPSGPQEYDFRTILRPAVVTLASPASLQTVGGGSSNEGQQLWEDSLMQLENTCVPDGPMAVPHSHTPRLRSSQEGSSQAMGQLLGHVPGGSIPAGGYASGMAPSRPQWNVHGHVSDASIKVGENVCDVAPSRPRWNVHGHVSDASIKVGENVRMGLSRPRNVYDGTPSDPRSDASIKVGETVCDVAPSRPRWNVHGHVSDASIKVGENVCDVAPSRPRWNVHGHGLTPHGGGGRAPPGDRPRSRQGEVCTSNGTSTDTCLSPCGAGCTSGEDQPDTPTPYQSPTDHESQSGLSLGAQSPVGGHEPRRPADRASEGSCSHVVRSGSGEASDQASVRGVSRAASTRPHSPHPGMGSEGFGLPGWGSMLGRPPPPFFPLPCKEGAGSLRPGPSRKAWLPGAALALVRRRLRPSAGSLLSPTCYTTGFRGPSPSPRNPGSGRMRMRRRWSSASCCRCPCS
uniref:Tubulin gamma complex component 6 n=1 Tax=Panthera leo TaxID=9689 RepID=A0A8C9D3I9_PANLE